MFPLGSGGCANGTSRAQSEVLGFVLVIALVIGGATAIAVIGGQNISETQEELTKDRAEKSMTQLAGKASLVAMGQADKQSVDLPDAAKYEEDGRMRINATNLSSQSTKQLVNKDLGALVSYGYAFQSGGVFTESRFVSPPEFHYRDGTLTIPVINVSGSPGSKAVFQPEQKRRVDVDNPLNNHIVEVEVTSKYYRGWGDYFEERMSGGVTYDHPNNTVRLRLLAPAENQGDINNAAMATLGSLTIGGNGVRTDSYNSNVEMYEGNASDSGNITVEGDLTLGGSLDFAGDSFVNGSFDCNGGGGSSYDGYVFVREMYTPSGGCHDSSKKYDIPSDRDPDFGFHPPVDGLIKEADNMTDDSGTPPTEGEISHGIYRVDGDYEPTGNLTIDTSAGSVGVYVDDDFVLRGDKHINITGPNRFELYVNGSEIIIERGGSPTTSPSITTDGPRERAPTVWLYGNEDVDVDITGQNNDVVRIEGVIYAPADGGSSSVDAVAAEIFGAVVAGDVMIQNGNLAQGGIHYDEALGDARPGAGDIFGQSIEFLQVTEAEITAD